MAPYSRQNWEPLDPGRHPGIAWIEANRSTLPDNSWVAATAAGELVAAEDIDAVFDQIESSSFALNDVAVAFITSDAV